METEYQTALLNWKRSNSGKDGGLPLPLAPEEVLLKLVPDVPNGIPFSQTGMLARWKDIEKKALGENPKLLFNDVLSGFKKRNIELKILEGDPRAIPLFLAPPKPNLKK